MSYKYQIISGFFFVTIIIFGGWFFFAKKQSIPDVVLALDLNALSVGQDSTTSTLPDVEDGHTFTDQENKYSFSIPSGYEVHTIIEDDVKTVLLEKSQSQEGIQIAITDFDGVQSDVTVTNIKESNPDLTITASKAETISGISAVALQIQESGGTTSEIWFLHGQKLFEVRASQGYESILEEVITSWHFN